jgi:hypothetical protein
MTITGDLGFAELTFIASDFSRDITYEWDNMAYDQWNDVIYGVYYPFMTATTTRKCSAEPGFSTR